LNKNTNHFSTKIKKKKKVDVGHQSRKTEVIFEILIERYLLNKEKKCRDFKRQQFNYLLSFVKFKLIKLPSNIVTELLRISLINISYRSSKNTTLAKFYDSAMEFISIK
jgi:hypothetical protein